MGVVGYGSGLIGVGYGSYLKLFLVFEKGIKSVQKNFEIISNSGSQEKVPAFLKYHVGLKSYFVQSRCSFYFLLRNYAVIIPISYSYLHFNKI